MNCQHIRQLLAFAEREVEGLDAGDRDAVQRHLAQCSACALMAQADRGFDNVLGPALRDVAVPADLKQRVLKRLAAERVGVSWKPWAAIAAALLIAVVGSTGWYYSSHPVVKITAAVEYAGRGGWDESQVEKFFADRGVMVSVPRDFDYNHLQHVDIVEFNHRRVAKLTFSRTDDRAAIASVLILSTRQFRIDDPELLKDHEIPHTTSIRIRPETRHGVQYTDLIFSRGQLDSLRRVLR